MRNLQGFRLLMGCLAALVPTALASTAQAQSWTLTFSTGTGPETTLGQSATFRFRVTNTSSTADRISFVQLPLPSGYTNIFTPALDTPPNWVGSVSGSTVLFQISSGKFCTGDAISPGGYKDFSVVATAGGAYSSDHLGAAGDRVTGATAGAGNKCSSGNGNNPFPGTQTSPPWNVHTLVLQALTASPPAVAPGSPITVAASFVNRATAPSDTAAAGPLSAGGFAGTLVAATGTVAPANGGVGTAQWTFTPSATGVVSFSLASLSDTVPNLSTQVLATPIVSNSVPVGQFGAAIALSPPNVSNGMTVTVTETVYNTSTMSASAVAPVSPPANGLATSGSATATYLSGPTPTQVATLAAGANTTFTWTYRITGTLGQGYTFSGQAGATLGGNPVLSNTASLANTVSAYTITSAPPGFKSNINHADWTVTLRNTGAATLRTISITNPNTTQFQTNGQRFSNDTSGWNSSFQSSGSTETYTFTAPNGRELAPGAQVTFTIHFLHIGIVTIDTTYTFTAVTTPSSGSPQTVLLPVIIFVPPGDPRAFYGMGLGGGTAHFYWTYADAAGTSAHAGAMVVVGPTAQSVTDNSVSPQDGQTYLPGQTLGTATVAFSDNDIGLPTGDDIATGLTAASTYYYRIFEFDQRTLYSPGQAPPSLAVPENGTDDRLFTYSIGFSALTQPLPSVGVGFYSVNNNQRGPLVGVGDGVELWRPPSLLGAAVQAQAVPGPFAAFAGDSIVVGDQAGIVTLVGASDGQVHWQTAALGDSVAGTPNVQFRAYSSISLPDDLVFVGTSNSTTGNPNKIYALKGSTGLTQWTFTGSNNIGLIDAQGVIDYARNRVYVPSRQFTAGAPTLWALDTVSGSLVWSMALGNIDVDLAQDGDTLYVATSSTLYAIDLNSHTIRWSLADTVRGGIWAWDFPGQIGLFYNNGSALKKYLDVAAATTPPTLAWSAAVSGGFLPFTLGGPIYTGSSNGTLYKLDQASGATLATRVVTSGQIGSPSVDSVLNRMYVGTLSGYVVAYPRF
jgi:hypothetical protein